MGFIFFFAAIFVIFWVKDIFREAEDYDAKDACSVADINVEVTDMDSNLN